jgi:hypothetical protein
MSWNSATAMIGSAKISRNDVTSVIHTNTGMRWQRHPGRAHVQDGDGEVRRRPATRCQRLQPMIQ